MIQARDTPELNVTQREWNRHTPHTSLIIECSTAATALPTLLSSLDQQTADHSGYEILFVADHNLVDSEHVIREWMGASDYSARLILREATDSTPAWQIGLEYAQGDWVSQPDGIARLDEEYLQSIEAARILFPDESAFAARAMQSSASGEELRQPLDGRYGEPAPSLIDLQRQPRLIHTMHSAVFFRRSVINQNTLRFHEGDVPISGTELIGHFLLCNNARYVIVPAAQCFYAHADKHPDTVFQHSASAANDALRAVQSHRRLLERAGGECPAWLANFLLYFVFDIFQQSRLTRIAVDSWSQHELTQVRELLKQNLRSIGARNVRNFDLVIVPLEIRMAWLAALKTLTSSPVEHLSWHPATATRKVGFYTSSLVKFEGFGVPDRRGPGIEWKPRTVEFFGGLWVYQYVVKMATTPTVPDRVLGTSEDYTLEFDGQILHSHEIRERWGHKAPNVPPSGPPVTTNHADRSDADGGPSPLLTEARLSPPLRESWVFLAVDQHQTLQCELLYRHVSRMHLGARASFVADRDSDHFKRLRHSGFRVIETGSPAHLAAMKGARYVVAPHAHQQGIAPFPGHQMERSWRTLLLPEHAIDRLGYRDASIELADFVAVASNLELDRLGGQFSKTHLLPSDLLLTGLPRHDLLQSAKGRPSDIVIAPAWTRGERTSTSVSAPAILEAPNNDTTMAWSKLLCSEEFSALLARTGRRAKLLAPEEALPPRFDAPENIEVVLGARAHVKAIAHAAVLLTDYSLYARDAAFLGRPSVYLHENPSTILGSQDSIRSQARAFRTEGFGPVVHTRREAVDALEELLQGTPNRYLRRMEDAFQFRDGNVCARIVREIRR